MLSGSGTTTLSGANTFGGGTTLSAGTLLAGNNAALGTGALNVAGAGGALGASVSGTALGNAVNLGTGATLALTGANDLGLNGVIAGNVGSRKPAAARRRCSVPIRFGRHDAERRRPRRQWRRAGDGALNVTGAGGSLGDGRRHGAGQCNPARRGRH